MLIFRAGQPQPRLMDQGRRLQRLSGPLLGHFVGRQFAPFLVHQLEKLLSSFAVAPLDAFQDAGDIAHAMELKCSRAIAEAKKGGPDKSGFRESSGVLTQLL